MNKELFEEKIMELTDSEKIYRDDPQKSKKLYEDERFHKDNRGVYRFDLFYSMKFSYGHHGIIYPGQIKALNHPDLMLNKQSRFSFVPLHCHDHVEMNYVYEGHCTVVIDGIEIKLNKGDLCFLDKDVVHTIHPLQQNDIVLNCALRRSYFSSRFLEKIRSGDSVSIFIGNLLVANAEHDHYLLFHTESEPSIHDLYEYMFCEYVDPQPGGIEAVNGYLSLIFTLLARCYQFSREQNYRDSSRTYITEVLRYIEKNCTTCTLDGTAQKFGFHPNYLTRAVKNATGHSFKDLVTKARLTNASFLLINSDQPVNVIADQCGWSNLNQFYKKFEELFGCTPREYREKNH